MAARLALALALCCALGPAGRAAARERLSIDDLLGGPKKTAEPAEAKPPAEPVPPLEPPATGQVPATQASTLPAAFSQKTVAGRDGSAVARSWTRLHEALRRRQYSVVTSEIEALETIRQQLGVQRLPDISNALLELAAQAQRDADTELAGRLIDAAENLSPGHIGAAFARAELSGGNRARFVGKWLVAYRRAMGWLPVKLAATGYGLLVAALSLGALGLLLALALLYRHLPPLAHDVAHALGLSKSAVWAPRLAILLLLLTPLATGWGALALAPLWIACCFPYASKRERALAPLVLLALAAVPLLLRAADRQLAHARAPALAQNLRARQEPYSPQLHAALANRVRKHPGDGVSGFSLAYLLTKGGLGEPARQQWERLIGRDPTRWQAYNNKAVSWVYEGRLEEAEAELRRGLEVVPSRALLHFNLSRVLLAKSLEADAQEAVRQARALDPVSTGAWERQGTGGALAASVHLAPLSEQEIAGSLDFPAVDRGRATSVSAALGLGGWTAPTAWALFCLCALLTLAVMRRRVHFSSSCERCGVAISARGAGAAQSRTICPQCVAAFYRKQVGDSESRLHKVAQVERYQRRRRWLLRLLSVVIPGAAQLGRGRTALGLALAAPALALALLAILAQGFPPGPPAADPYLITRAATWPISLLAAPVLALLSLAGIVQNLLSEK